MKKIMKNIAAAVCVALLSLTAGCSADKFDGVDPNGRPDANEIDATVTVDQETNTYTLTLNNKGYYPVWTVNVGRNPKVSTINGLKGVIAEKGTYQVEVRMGNRNGLSEGSKVYEIEIENNIGGDIFKGFDYNSPFNLWKSCNITGVSTWFANNDWGEIAAPSLDITNEGFSVVLPSEIGTQQWQGQVHIATDMSTSASNHYDFSIFLLSAAAHPGVTVKLHPDGDDDTFYCANQVALEAGVGKCFYLSDLEGIDMANMVLTLDFGGGEGGTEVTVSDIVLKDHANDDGTVLPPAVEFDDVRNLFADFKAVKVTTWFADAGWSDGAIAQPSIDVTSDGYSFVMPSGVGSDQWQGQVHMWTDVATSSDKRYDFCITFTSTEDHPGATIKLQKGDSLGDDPDTDDNVSFCLDKVVLKANVPYTYYFEDLPGIDSNNIQVCCDYAGGVAGSEITVSNLHLQEHL